MPKSWPTPLALCRPELGPTGQHLADYLACTRTFYHIVVDDHDREALRKDWRIYFAMAVHQGVPGGVLLRTIVDNVTTFFDDELAERPRVVRHAVVVRISPDAPEISFALERACGAIVTGTFETQPPWLKDVLRWYEDRPQGPSKHLTYTTGSDVFDIVGILIAYATAHGYALVRTSLDRVYLLDPKAVEAVEMIDPPPKPGEGDLAERVLSRKSLSVWAAGLGQADAQRVAFDAVTSALRGGTAAIGKFQPSDELRLAGLAMARQTTAEALRYVRFMSDLLDASPVDLRARAQTALEILLATRRVVQLLARLQYQMLHVAGRFFELLARIFPLPGPAAAEMVRPRGMQDWSDAVVDLACAWCTPDGREFSTDAAPARVAVEALQASIEAMPSSDVGEALKARHRSYKALRELARSPEVSWPQLYQSVAEVLKLY